ncbi:hypothetical protein AX17_006383, partial [Amanita inopinata Kibby_2008]
EDELKTVYQVLDVPAAVTSFERTWQSLVALGPMPPNDPVLRYRLYEVGGTQPMPSRPSFMK